jgi:arylsulfatase A-like enzyme
MTERPNIVLIMADQQRMDSLACYGNRFVASPALDRLAAEGTRFTTALTPWPVCTPARGTLWTGVYPHTHGLIDNVYGIANAFASVAAVGTTLFDHLRASGYQTAHFGKWHLGEEQPPFFDVWETSFNSRVGHWVDGLLDGVYRPDLQTDASIAFLRERARGIEPFMMVQSYYPPHDPYSAPARFYAPYRGRGVPFAGYYAAVGALDEDVGRIMAALCDTGLAPRTLVIYVSDHGDTFWYRQDGEHKFVCTDDALRVPLLISWPGRIAAGPVIDPPVGLQDLLPTILDYADAPLPAGLHGKSLRPLLEQRAVAWRDDFYVQTITHRRKVEQRALRTRDWKLIVDAGGQHELYNLQADPEEELNVYLTPRDDGGFRRFDHYPSYASVIVDVVARLRRTATAIDDRRGLELAGLVERELASRAAAS